MEVKVGDIVLIKNGRSLGRDSFPKGRMLVKVKEIGIRFNDEPYFYGTPVNKKYSDLRDYIFNNSEVLKVK